MVSRRPGSRFCHQLEVIVKIVLVHVLVVIVRNVILVRIVLPHFYPGLLAPPPMSSVEDEDGSTCNTSPRASPNFSFSTPSIPIFIVTVNDAQDPHAPLRRR
jgi:hypothetical protein